jgi:ATP-binding cassette subfamily C (CFTR/MRP) protein 1
MEKMGQEKKADFCTKGSIEVNELSVAYPSNPTQNVLQKITVQIKSGEKVGIVGRTGSGKSTLLSALFRTVEHSEGQILIDGTDISQLDLQTLRSHMSIIPQKPCIFEGTIRSNLCLDREYRDEELWEGLRQVGLEETISGMPAKLDSPVETNGRNFSVGQVQLLCFARAILKNCRILVLDEATSSSDHQTQSKITQFIKEKLVEVTILCIAHRLDTILGFDKILVLNEGRVAEFGCPDALLQTPGSMFGQLVNSSGIDSKS